jgi:pimeloyl-ACP methyl ester carboxylesterase
MPLASAGSWLAGPDMLFTGSRHRDRQRSGRAMIPLTDPGRREMALVLGVGVRRAASIVASATVLLLILGCGANPDSGTETPSAQSPSGSQAPSTPSEFNGTFNVNGRDLLLSCTGNGEPTMILEAGEAVPSDAMDAVRAAYDSDLRVCSYDRANQGQSGSAPTPRTADDLIQDLHGLLAAAKVPGQYLLVGHSAGGLLVQAYAAAYPGEVAGVVALNPVPLWGQWSTRGFSKMTAEERRSETAYYAGENGESLNYRDISERIKSLEVPTGIPFHVLISTTSQCDSPDDICSRTYPAYETIMKELAGQWTEGRFRQVDAPHEIYNANLATVREVIDDVRSRAGG